MFDTDTEYYTGSETIPEGLDDLPPGAELAGVLDCIDVDRLPAHDRLVVLRAQARMRAFYDAEYYDSISAISAAVEAEEHHPEAVFHAVTAEIQAALRLTRRASEAEVSFALDLRRRLPTVWESLASGSIDYRRARVLASRTGHLSTGAARKIVSRVIAHAGSLTTGQLQARIDRLAMEHDTGAAKDRYYHAVTRRRIVTEATVDGTGNLLGLDMAPHRLAAASRRINHIARSLKTADETRTMDQLRADVFLDLLIGTDEHAGKGTVHINVDLDTLTALANHPGDLNGYGAVVADIARQVTDDLDDAEWRFTVTDTATGGLVADGTTTRRPSTALRRRVETRNPTCIFPGCRMPSVDCDIDHTRRWVDGGPTTEANHAPLCRHNHLTKDQLGWSYRRLADGDYLWTSRLGHRYTTSGRSP